MEEIARLVHEYGDLIYLGSFLWTFFEGETFVLFGGYAAHAEIIDPWLLLISAWAGTFLGDQTWFLLGRRFGPGLVKRFPKWEPGVEVALDMLNRYDTWFILSFRFIYGIRNVSSVACGLSKLTWARFAFLNFVAGGIWAGTFVGVGYGFGQLSEAVLGKTAKAIGLGALAIFIVAVMILIRRHQKELKKQVVASGRHLEDDLRKDPQG